MPKKRKGTSQQVKPVFKIFCEGEKTEPLYIKAYINHFHPEKRRIILVEDTTKNTPIQLVEEAVSAKRQGNKNDIIWVVFDRESEAKYPHQKHQEARQKANANNIQIAFSNVCFEYWILLHFGFTAGCFSSYDDLRKRSKLIEHLANIGIQNYDKAHPLIFDKIKDKVLEAIKNANRLKQQAEASADVGREAPHYLNPYVDVQEMFIDMTNFLEGKPSIRA